MRPFLSYGVKENRRAEKGCSILTEKQNYFPYRNILIGSLEKV